MTNGKPGSATTFGWFTALLLSALLAGCGGGGGGGAPTTTVEGQGNFGAEIVGGTVQMVCAGSTPGTTVTTSATGGFTVAALGSAPCVIKISGGNLPAGVTFYSIFEAGQTRANVNQLTTMLAFQLAGGNPETFFTSPSSISTKITAAAVLAHKATIITNVIAVLGNAVTPPISLSFDFLQTAFTANSTGFDQMLDKLGFTSAGSTASIMFNGAPILTVNLTTGVASTTTSPEISPTVLAAAGPSGTAAASPAKTITAFSFVGFSGNPGVITEGTTPKTIAVTLPSGTPVTALTATFETTGSSVTVAGVTQTSGAAPTNNFTSSVDYIVTAADSTTATYTVTVTVPVASAAGPAPVDLLSISTNNFVILSASPTTGITDTGSHTAAITGNIGLSPATAAAIGVRCSEMTGNIYGADVAYVGDGADVTCFKGTAPDNTLVANAVLDMVNTIYPDAAGRAQGADAAHLNVGAGTLSGQDFPPGTYTWNTPGDVNITGDITLTGGASDVWLFQMTGDLTTTPKGTIPLGVKVLLIGGAQASNVFWQVGGGTGATLGTYSTFNGNILSAKQVVMQTGAVLHGRALAQTAVILDVNTVGP